MLSLPGGLNGRELARRALEAGVVVAPGEEFHIHGGENTIRLNFSHATFDQIRLGISKLADSVRVLAAQTISDESRRNPADLVRG
jgi:DNA-binding transcriptional MocR family regulator